MRTSLRRQALIAAALLVALSSARALSAQAPATGTAALKEVHTDGLTGLSEAQVAALTGLQPGAQVGKAELQAAADKLVATGLFETVSYNFKTRDGGVTLNFHLKEAKRVPVYYDNFPWFGDSELNEAVKAQLPFFDGTLPEGGNVLDTAADAIRALLATHKLDLPVQHQVTANPLADGNIQQFTVEGASIRIASLEFSDKALADNSAVQQHLTEIVGKPYSRTMIEIFLAEQIRPVYLKMGFLKAKLGPPEVRLSGTPPDQRKGEKLPDEIPVFVPIVTNAVYKFADAQWTGNNVISSISLSGYFGLKPGALADGMEIEASLDRIREEYGRRGYLDATVQPTSVFDDMAHTVSYNVAINEGPQYRMGGWVITGISSSGEQRVRSAFPIAAGDVFDKIKYEDFLVALQNHAKEIFQDAPIHYETVGHWLKPDESKRTVDVLLDFK